MRASSVLALGALGLVLPASGVAQAAHLDPSKEAAFRQHVASLLGARGHPLPSGDTAVSWTDRGPILYFTTQVAGDTVSSAMAREDGLIGSAVAIWSDTVLAGFHVVWTRGDSVVMELTGRAHAGRLLLTGTRDTSFALPAIPWLAADYGLEDQGVPLLRRLPHTETRLAVLRPYVLKWDTVTVTSRQSGPYLIITARQGLKVRETYVLDDHGLLLLRRSDVVMERRPLEGTPRYDQYVRALAVARLDR